MIHKEDGDVKITGDRKFVQEKDHFSAELNEVCACRL